MKMPKLSGDENSSAASKSLSVKWLVDACDNDFSLC